MSIFFTYTQAALQAACNYNARIFASEQIAKIYGHIDFANDGQVHNYCIIKDAAEDVFCYVPSLWEVSQAEDFLKEETETEDEDLPF